MPAATFPWATKTHAALGAMPLPVGNMSPIIAPVRTAKRSDRSKAPRLIVQGKNVTDGRPGTSRARAASLQAKPEFYQGRRKGK